MIALLKELQRELDLSYVFISHDLDRAAIRDDVLVMLNGEVVKRLPADRLQDGATHPYSKLLFASVPKLEPRLARQPRRHSPGCAPRDQGADRANKR